MGIDAAKYSKKVEGNRGNYNWPVRFDITGNGYLGITQFEGDTVKDHVLLSPKQVHKLMVFAKKR